MAKKIITNIAKCGVPLLRSIAALDKDTTPELIAEALCDEDISVRKCAALNPCMRDPLFFLAVESILRSKQDKKHLNFLRRMTRKINEQARKIYR